jgi:hypothetical protein
MLFAQRAESAYNSAWRKEKTRQSLAAAGGAALAAAGVVASALGAAGKGVVALAQRGVGGDGRAAGAVAGDFIATLQSRGFNITKHGRKGKPHRRRLWLTSDAKRLNVSGSGGMSSKGLPLSEVIAGRIVEGFQTAVFERSGCHAASEDCCMSIIAKSRSLDIECESEAERNQLVLGLRSLVLHIMEQQD